MYYCDPLENEWMPDFIGSKFGRKEGVVRLFFDAMKSEKIKKIYFLLSFLTKQKKFYTLLFCAKNGACSLTK